MGQSALFIDQENTGSQVERLPPQSFEKLQELTRHGYLPDPTPHGDGILLRHASGPDLVLRPDGTIDLPTGQGAKNARRASSRTGRQISWRRSFLFLIVLMSGILVGWLMTAVIFS